MNKKFKNRNRGLVTFGIVALSAVALTASGFAAWVISGNDTQKAEGNIQVDTVENNNHTLAVTLSNENIKFGSVSGGASWLTNTNMAESLSTTASITVSNVTSDPTADISKILSVPTIKITKTIETVVTDVTATNYNIIADGSATAEGIGEELSTNGNKNGLVGALPTFTTSSYTGVSYDPEAKTLSCSLTVAFTWGQLFGGNNPRTYYADKKVEEYGEEAQRRLTALNTALSGCNYVLTIASK